jgi:hypothetical protein
MAPVAKSYTESYKQANKINLDTDTASDPEDAFDRKLWFQKLTGQSLQVKILTLAIGFAVIYESRLQLNSLASGDALVSGHSTSSVFLGKDDHLNDWGLFTALRYQQWRERYPGLPEPDWVQVNRNAIVKAIAWAKILAAVLFILGETKTAVGLVIFGVARLLFYYNPYLERKE